MWEPVGAQTNVQTFKCGCRVCVSHDSSVYSVPAEQKKTRKIQKEPSHERVNVLRMMYFNSKPQRCAVKSNRAYYEEALIWMPPTTNM